MDDCQVNLILDTSFCLHSRSSTISGIFCLSSRDQQSLHYCLGDNRGHSFMCLAGWLDQRAPQCYQPAWDLWKLGPSQVHSVEKRPESSRFAAWGNCLPGKPRFSLQTVLPCRVPVSPRAKTIRYHQGFPHCLEIFGLPWNCLITQE